MDTRHWFRGAATAVLFASLFGIAACGGEPAVKDATPTPVGATSIASATTAVATSTPTAEQFLSCPDPDRSVCAFAARAEADLLAGDGSRLAQGAIEREIVCNPQDEFLAEVCRGQPGGARLKGVDVGRTYSEGSTIDRAAFAKYLGTLRDGAVAIARDDYGPGAFRLYSIGERPAADCAACRVLVFSKVEAPALNRLGRSVQLLYVEKQAGEWKIRSVIEGVQLGQDIPVKLRGGTLEKIVYRVWNPKDGTTPAGSGGIWFAALVTVKTGSDCLNLRSTASKTGAVLECAKDGTRLQVFGGPEQADGLKWWRVLTVGPGKQTEGWAAADFLADPQ